MGQYFKIVNLDKKEIIHPHSAGCGAKFFEGLWNNMSRLFPYLLRQSDEGGGGDIQNFKELVWCGHWAGNKIVVVGDYDSSGLYETTRKKRWIDITQMVIKEFNSIVNEKDKILSWEETYKKRK